MHKKSKKLILTILTAIILVTTVTIYVLWNKPHKKIEDAAAVKITAVDLYNIFMNDSAKAKSLYVGKVVQVSGKLSVLSINQQAQQIILIKTAVAGAYINCTMEKKTVDFKAGDTIIIKGICSGYINGDIDMGLPGDVILIRGYTYKHI